jgi:hypothetical protein
MMDPEDKFLGRWEWCYTCGTAIISCEHCGNSSCNGGGCEKCHSDFEEVGRIIRADREPGKAACEEWMRQSGKLPPLPVGVSPNSDWTEEELRDE